MYYWIMILKKKKYYWINVVGQATCLNDYFPGKGVLMSKGSNICDTSAGFVNLFNVKSNYPFDWMDVIDLINTHHFGLNHGHALDDVSHVKTSEPTKTKGCHSKKPAASLVGERPI